MLSTGQYTVNIRRVKTWTLKHVILILFIHSNIIFSCEKPTICTYKVYIKNVQSSLLHVSAVNSHLQGATLKICLI